MYHHSNYRTVLFILTLLIFSTNIFADQSDFDVIYYSLNIKVNPQTEMIEGAVHMKAISQIDGLSEISLDLYSNMNVDSITGDAANFTHDSNLLNIQLASSLSQNDTLTVTIFYHGHPESGTAFNPMTFDRSRDVVTISSESCPYYARCWWPCKDRPDDKPESMNIKITVPANLVAASNGYLKEVITNNDNTKTYHWHVKNPIATYLVAFTATNYQIIEDEYINAANDTLEIMEFVFPEDYNDALIDFNNVQQMIEVLSSYYGKYPYYDEKYGIAEYAGYWDGMEYQTLVCLQPYLIRGDHFYDATFLHEMAHQWWGDCVTPASFHHSWLSEGFAVFSEALYYGHLEGQEKYHDYMNNENNALNLTGIMYRHDISAPDIVYDYIVYNKGAWVIHMLRRVVGEDKFWDGLQLYFNRFKYASANTEDLQQAFEDVTGDTLGWFFQQWVYEPGYPHYAYGWEHASIAGTYTVRVIVDQIQTEFPLFTMPVDITFYSADWDSTATVIVDDTTQSFLFTPSKTLTDVQIDKDDWILKKSQQFTQPLIQYVEHQIVDSTENNNGLAEAGETVELPITVINKGLTAFKVTCRLITDDPDIELANQVVELNFMGGPGFIHLSQENFPPFTFSVSPAAQGHLTTFKLEMTAEDISEFYTMTDSFDVKIGKPSILLVDDDNGADYENYFHDPLSLSKVYIDNWEVTAQGIPGYSQVLQNYQTVIWFTGDDRTSSLTHDEQSALKQYLDTGGWLLLTGQDIGYDLITDGTNSDSLFYTNYLHAEFVSDTIKPTMIIGVPGDPISQGLFINIDPNAGAAQNQFSPSVIQPIDGAQTFLKYIPGMAPAGIRYMDPVNSYRLVYLPFGIEGIAGPYDDSAQRLINSILNWLTGETEVKLKDAETVPRSYLLEQNYPNPFNSNTTIKFHLPKQENVELNIYNLMGQKIKSLVDNSLPAGIYKQTWNGRNDDGHEVASGIYIYKLESKNFLCAKKLILIK